MDMDLGMDIASYSTYACKKWLYQAATFLL